LVNDYTVNIIVYTVNMFVDTVNMLSSKETMTIRVARKKPDSYQHGDLPEALIQAGLKLLSEQGLAGLSLRAAAQLAGVSHAAPYRHFADKQALVAAIAERGFRLLTASMREELAACPSGRAIDQLLALGVGYVRFGTRHPDYLRVIFGGAVETEAQSPALRAAGDEAYGVLRDLIAAGLERRELRGGDADLLALTAWSLVHGLSALLSSGAIPTPPTAAAERDLVLASLRQLAHGIDNVAG
jgi:AcrR family transcriptional regulator